MEDLIYDRLTPVPLNHEDLTRIEGWTRWLADQMRFYGYDAKVATKAWTMESIPWRGEIDRVRDNVNALYFDPGKLKDWIAITYTDSLDFGQVNALEWDLLMVYAWSNFMASMSRHCGTFSCGFENGVRL